MSKPTRQRPGNTSELGRRLQPTVEELMPEVVTAPASSPATVRPRQAEQDVKESFSTRIPRATLAAARAAVMATAGRPGGCRSLADLITQAVEAKTSELERQFNDNKPFPTPDRFRAGRPLGS